MIAIALRSSVREELGRHGVTGGGPAQADAACRLFRASGFTTLMGVPLA